MLSTTAFASLSLLISAGAPAATATTTAASPRVTAGTEGISLSLGEDWEIGVAAQYRPRFTGHTGRDLADGPSPAFVDHRARLGLTLAHSGGASIRMSVQDVRMFGEELDNLNDFSANGLDLHEAFATLELVDALELRIGRQEITVCNQRLIGAVNWSQRARSFDGARALADLSLLEADLFFAKVREADRALDGNVPAGRGTDTDLAGLTLTRSLTEKHSLSIIYLFHGLYTTKETRHTVGAFTSGAASGFDYTLEANFQFGDLDTESISALMGALNVGYTFDAPTKPALTFWGEYLGGDGTRQGTFDTLYATNHKHYGEMDFFINIPVHTQNLGLIDVGGRAALKPFTSLGASVAFHHLRPVEGGNDGTYGNEIDLKLIWDLIDHVQIRALYGIFLPEEGMRSRFMIPAGTDLELEHFAYVTTDVQL